MARRIGAYAVWRPSTPDLPEDVQGMIDRTTDLAPVMRPLAHLFAAEGRDRLARGGDGDWAPKAQTTIERWGDRPLGIGEGGGFASTIQPFFSSRNAGWRTRAPHAHLFGEGVNWYHGALESDRRVRYGSRAGGRVSRARQRTDRRIGSEHQPGRGFAYIAVESQEQANERIAGYILRDLLPGGG